MKDLYTFDYSSEAALAAYEQVREAYSHIFIDEMKLPVLVAQASSGDMGGSLSHEYHLPTALGEDHVMSCQGCGYVANEELAESRPAPAVFVDGACNPKAWHGISKDRKTLVRVWFNADQFSAEEISNHAVKQVFPELDSGVEDPAPYWAAAIKEFTTSNESQVRVVNLFDDRLPQDMRSQPTLDSSDSAELRSLPVTNHKEGIPNPFRIKEGDACPRCDDGRLRVQKAIELGHTFHLGTRYSEPLGASVSVPARLLPENNSGQGSGGDGATIVPIQMGCHGIGISRIIGAVADHLADERGLNWPRVIAPHEVVIVFHSQDNQFAKEAADVYDILSPLRVDTIIDDRLGTSLSWKLKDADLIGYPVIVVLGKQWKDSRRLEVQCRRLRRTDSVLLKELGSHVRHLLDQL
jgi:prolyl-tRNA synthetase